jgi:hypothetical protein
MNFPKTYAQFSESCFRDCAPLGAARPPHRPRIVHFLLHCEIIPAAAIARKAGSRLRLNGASGLKYGSLFGLNPYGGGRNERMSSMLLTRLTLCAATVLTLSAGYAAARSVTTVADTNLRKGPATSSESLVMIPKGTTVEVEKCSNGWCEVKWNDQSGFAFAGNVMGPVLGGSRRPPNEVSVAADMPGPGRPPIAGGPPMAGGPPLPEGPPVGGYYEDDDEYGPPPGPRGPGYAYRPLPPPAYGPGYGPPPRPYGPPPGYYDRDDWGPGWRRW